MNDRLLSFMGICRRAGKLVIGNDPVKESIETDKALLIITASDISSNTLKKIKPVIEASKVPWYQTARTKDEISFSIGKACAILAVTDKGFADKFKELMESEQKKEETTI